VQEANALASRLHWKLATPESASLPTKAKEAVVEAVGFEGFELIEVSGAPVSISHVREAGALSLPAALRDFTWKV
jgi:hypothetical protein